jgi:hypothetical protein
VNATRPILVLVLLAACGDAKEEHAQSLDTVSSATVTASMDGFAGRGVSLAPTNPSAAHRLGRVEGRAGNAATLTAPAALPAAEPAPRQQTVASNMIIRNGSVTIQVDSIERAIERIRAMANALGGMVGGLVMNTGEHQVRSATLELKIPALRFDSAMTGMPALGKVEQSSTHAMDVGEEFMDVTARVANAKRLEERLISLLANRTARLNDVLAVERELARVREEIERYEGRIRLLSSRVATSMITATVHEKMPIIAAQPGQNVFARAFLNMWRNFIRVLTAGIEMLGVLIPMAALVGLVYFVWRRWLRTSWVRSTP